MDSPKSQDVASRLLPPARPVGPTLQNSLGDNLVSQDLKDTWIRDGFTVLRGAVNGEVIEKYNALVAGVRAGVREDKDAYGFGDRIGQLHQQYTDLMDLASNPHIIDFLTWAFGDEAILFGSLNFERGTEQDAHIDAIFFWPEPSYSMAGVWVALEDAKIDAGPLFYVPRSHTWPFYNSDHVVDNKEELQKRRAKARDGELEADEKNALVGELGVAWTSDFKGLEKHFNTERVKMELKAGDVVVWHSLLAHGGSPRVDPSLSRKSVVFHYIGLNTRLYSFEQFMLFGSNELNDQVPVSMNLGEHKGLKYMKFPQFTTYVDGKETLHPVTRDD